MLSTFLADGVQRWIQPQAAFKLPDEWGRDAPSSLFFIDKL
jgi:hypothetical protein